MPWLIRFVVGTCFQFCVTRSAWDVVGYGDNVCSRLISKGFIVMESLLRTKIAHGNKLETF